MGELGDVAGVVAEEFVGGAHRVILAASVAGV
jgi:hypothetical protein